MKARDVKRLHAEYSCRILERLAKQRASDAAAQFELEWPHFREALEWAASQLAHDDAAILVDRLALAAARLLPTRRGVEEAIRWARSGARAAKRFPDRRVNYARHLVHLAAAYARLGDHELGVPIVDEAYQIARHASGGERVVLEAIAVLAELLLLAEKPEAAFNYAQSTLAKLDGRDAATQALGAQLMLVHAEAALLAGENAAGPAHITRGFARKIGDMRTYALATSLLGATMLDSGWRWLGRGLMWRARRAGAKTATRKTSCACRRRCCGSMQPRRIASRRERHCSS